MMPVDPHLAPKIIQLSLELSQYPILSRRIRQRMREEMFQRGIVSVQRFEDEVVARAVESQRREGLTDPMYQETGDVWQIRVERVRDDLTDFYFAYNLPHGLLEQIVREVISQRAPDQPVVLTFNPELAPWDMLFAQGEEYEALPPENLAAVQHHLQEIIVVLVKTLISDQLRFVGVARRYLRIADLKSIVQHRIGRGKIGGKAAGMILAYTVLKNLGKERGLDVENLIHIPDSYFLGADVYYDFKSSNDLFPFMNQKYRPHEDMIADYPKLYDLHMRGQFPDYVIAGLTRLLEQVGDSPLIVRSSSLLEDNFDKSFAGKYDSFFLPNQGTPEQNLKALTEAITKVYASVIRPDALIYRQSMDLIDYDERMAILIQRVEGQRHGRYYFPAFAGVAFSRNPYRWTERIRAEDGLLRIVAGLGTRAVDRVSSDYPRMVALSHPSLRPERGADMIRHYSQQYMDVIDLEENALKTVHFTEVIGREYPALGATISLEQDGYLKPLTSRPLRINPREMVITFDSLLGGEFVTLMRDTLAILSEAYDRAVDTEFAGEVVEQYPKPKVHLALLQCRPLSHSQYGQSPDLPDVEPENVLFTSRRQVPSGKIEHIRTIVYVDPVAYDGLVDAEVRVGVGRVVGRLNGILPHKSFIIMGPGRWGTSNINLGVKVTYADIYHTSVMVEIARTNGEGDPEVSYGTHFFQDLVEANIYPLSLFPDDGQSIYRRDFFTSAPNQLADLLPADAGYSNVVRVIDLARTLGGLMTVVMNSDQDKAIAFITRAHSDDDE
jgi:hypothetical protein